MTETTQLFARLHQANLLEIASYLDLDSLQNLVEVVEGFEGFESFEVVTPNKYLKTTLMSVINIRMDEVRQKSRLLLWVPEHFTRNLNVLSDSSLAHVSLLITLFGDENTTRTLKYMKHTFSEVEQPALLYIKQFFDKSSQLYTRSNTLYKEILDECVYRNYVNNIG